MAKKILGTVLVVIGFFGVGYFRSYHGDLIPLPTLWFIISLLLIVIGVVLPYNARTKKENKMINEESSRVKLLKEKGEKIILNIDFCQFKENNFQEVVEPNSFAKVQMYDALGKDNYNSNTIERNQIAIIYNHQIKGKEEKFISPVFSMESVTLQVRIMNKSVILYVDRFNRNNYYFEFNN